MPRGKPVPANQRYKEPVKFSAVVDKSTQQDLTYIAGSLIKEFDGNIPTQGQTITFLVEHYKKITGK
ncbi:hypothetical protein [Macrococcus carouselicus]|uniref:Uncharacterized protein n=1 Tax=Macrococcus carouselicus TaxID=69969 RepID=A0A9Q8FPW9_9STAP|nr:hypothetical protein [Macrococcus carouselicus]TDM02389.1 hypothetical protein ERX40_07485 [Macrococcus carouselicus]